MARRCIYSETFEKWLRRNSKIFFASRWCAYNYEWLLDVKLNHGPAKNIWFAACEPFFCGYAKLSQYRLYSLDRKSGPDVGNINVGTVGARVKFWWKWLLHAYLWSCCFWDAAASSLMSHGITVRKDLPRGLLPVQPVNLWLSRKWRSKGPTKSLLLKMAHLFVSPVSVMNTASPHTPASVILNPIIRYK